MSDLISRRAAKLHLCFEYAYAAADLLDEVPAVDAVEVVRCKDCRHAEVVRNKGVVMYIGCGYFPNNILSKDFYCANGSAKMDGGDADV